jgi:hypothetical protein
MRYPLIRSTLEGSFGASVGFFKAQARDALSRDLTRVSVRHGLLYKLERAFSEEHFAWREVFSERDVAYVAPENEATQIAPTPCDAMLARSGQLRR